MTGFRILLMLCLVLGVNVQASATSCMPHQQRYFIRCDASGCHGAFAVVSVPAFKTCGRRPEVEEIDADVAQFVGKLVIELQTKEARGLYQLTLSEHWYPQANTRLERFMSQLEESLPHDEQGQGCKVREASPSEIAALIGKSPGKVALERVTEDETLRGAQARRAAFATESIKERYYDIVLEIGYWASSLIVVIALIHSTHVYFSRLYQSDRDKGEQPLSAPVVMQLAIAGVGIAPLILIPFSLWPGSIVVPAVVVLLLCEGWAKWLVSRRPPPAVL